MTRTYALKRLLEHGAMTPAEIVRCTRWEIRQVQSALCELKKCGLVRRVRRHETNTLGFAYEAVL